MYYRTTCMLILFLQLFVVFVVQVDALPRSIKLAQGGRIELKVAPPDDDANAYLLKIVDKLKEQLHFSGKGEDVYATMRLLPDGSLADLRVNSPAPLKSIEPAIQQALTKSQPWGVPPSKFKGKNFAWLSFSWGGPGGLFIDGPWIVDEIPSNVSVRMGNIANVPYQMVLVQKILAIKKNIPGSGRAKAYLKLNQNGAITKIFVVPEPKNEAAQKAIYSVLQQAHPFGVLNATVQSSPFFEAVFNWSGGQFAVSVNHLSNPPSWLR